MCAQNPFLVGISVDEDTDLVASPELGLEVVGSGAVTVLDGREMTYTNVNEIGRGESLAITDIRMHLLPSGFRFDREDGIDATRREVSPRLRELMDTLVSK